MPIKKVCKTKPDLIFLQVHTLIPDHGKLFYCHNGFLHKSANFWNFFVHGISYRPTDLSLLKEFSKKISFEDFHNF